MDNLYSFLDIFLFPFIAFYLFCNIFLCFLNTVTIKLVVISLINGCLFSLAIETICTELDFLCVQHRKMSLSYPSGEMRMNHCMYIIV